MTRRESNAELLAEITALRDRVASQNRQIAELQEVLAQASHREVATSEILGVIRQSPTDVRPVFDTIVKSAVKLCDGVFGGLYRFDGELIHSASTHNYSSEVLETIRSVFPARPSRTLLVGRTVLERVVVQVPDLDQDQELELQELGRVIGARSSIGIPMLRDRTSIGAIVLSRAQPGSFSDSDVALLKTFADQAVIAIENVRLFKELEARDKDLAEALDQQTATGEILRVISSSPTDIQPVFDSIAQSAARLCEALDVSIFQVDGDRLAFVAHHGPIAQRHGEFWLPLVRGTVGGRSVLDSRTIQVADLQQEDHDFPDAVENARRFGFRTILSVPLLRDGIAIGGIQLRRTEVQLFSDQQIALLQTFADQAVIAIENVRLFTELQTSNRDLTTALDKQTATSEILRVISQSQTDVQPVFNAIVKNAVRLLGAYGGALTRVEADRIELAALTSTDATGDAAVRAGFPQSRHSNGAHARVIRDRVPLNVGDTETDPRTSGAWRHLARARAYRSLAGVPLLRHDGAIGAITVTRREPGGFTEDEIALLKTFADQAVIAIENARLLSELQARTQELTRSVEQLTALGEVGRTVSSSLDLDTVLTTIVSRAVELSRADGGSMYEYDMATEEFSLRASYRLDDPDLALRREIRIRKGEGAAGQLAVSREPVQIPDITVQGAYDSRLRGALLRAGGRAVLAVPLLHEEHLIGGLVVSRNTPGEFPPEAVELLRTFASQSALAIQNARLFREIEIKSRQLEIASQHKSEFLANMSHELRTPLNAIIGFSEVLTDRMFGELNDKQEEYLKDIYASGTHLLSLINDILDLSKIEAGRMELEVTEFDLPTAIENALMLVRERAGRRSLTLQTGIDDRLGQIQADERKVRQVVLNLLSNAIKFTPEGGRIDVSVLPKDGFVEVSVSDTGIGIAPEDQEKVFEEFRQVGTAAKKIEGTGLGLTLCRKFVELHGGQIWVKSQLGQGSTFTFTVPVRRREVKSAVEL